MLNVERCSANLSAPQFTGSASWNDAYVSVVFPTIEDGAMVGGNLADLSRINHLLTVLVKLRPESPPDATSVHPAWRNPFAFVNEPVRGPWDGVNGEMLEVVANTTARLNDMFGEAAYYNEEYSFTDNWQQLFFGDNYPRLLKNKKELDLSGVFSCVTCPGSEGGV